jgi:hypothetical protein
MTAARDEKKERKKEGKKVIYLRFATYTVIEMTAGTIYIHG